MTTATLPPLHAAYTGGDASQALQDVRTLVEHAIANQPRSLQKRIGPSELGNPCTHCLAARLARWEQTERGVPWLPAVGTAVHTMFSDFIIGHENDRNAQHTTGIRWLSEQTVTVGHIGDTAITGSVDLFDTHTGTVLDFKVVGATTLRTAKAGPSPLYRTQVNLYARGFKAAGYDVRHVAIWYVPRNSVSLDHGVVWHEPYDQQIAVAALERANHLQRQIDALAVLGDDVVNGWISSLDRAPGCHDCSRYADRPTAPVPTSIDEAMGGL